MPTPIGVDLVTSVSRHILLPVVTDNFYKSNTLTWRMLQSNRRRVRGGTHIEGSMLYDDMQGGGWFTGFDKITITPSDTIKNARWDWRFLAQPVVIDGTTLARLNSDLAIADGVSLIINQAEMKMAEWIAQGLWSDGYNPKSIDGLGYSIDDGTYSTSATYANLDRSTNTWFKGKLGTSSTVLSENLLMDFYFQCTDEGGGRTPTIIVSQYPQYVRYFNLNTGNLSYNASAGGTDELMFQKGVSNQVFNGIPWLIDSHVPTAAAGANSSEIVASSSSSTSDIFFLNEEYLFLYELEGWNFTMDDFMQPYDQIVYTSMMRWGGQLVNLSPKHSGRLIGIAA